MSLPVVVSCLFGTQPFDVYPAPDPGRYVCLFFTNRREIAERAEEQGWTVCRMPWPQTPDPVISALQSKAIKFLRFLDDPFVARAASAIGGEILYFDHKFRVSGDHVRRIRARAEGAGILLRSTPKLKISVWDEVADAELQERYLRHMPETLRYIEGLLKGRFSPDVRICNTGLIYYADIEAAKPLATEVFNACTFLQQPECQIFWALLAQRYADNIRIIDWDDPAVVDILWKDPHPVKDGPTPRLSLLDRLVGKARKLSG